MNELHAVAAAAVLVCLFWSDAAAFKKCKTRDGKLMFTDSPPPGCIVEGELENDESSAPSAESAPDVEDTAGRASTDAADAQSIAARRRIERELGDAADELARVRRELAAAPRKAPGVYVNEGDGRLKVFEQAHVEGEAASEIGGREKRVVGRIEGLKDEFANLTREVEERHEGRAPSWWAPLRCDRCP